MVERGAKERGGGEMGEGRAGIAGRGEWGEWGESVRGVREVREGKGKVPSRTGHFGGKAT